jgi:hypothetical protein
MRKKYNIQTPKDFYVYAYLRAKDGRHGKKGTPYYIGKGKGRRIVETHNKISLPPDGKNIILIADGLTEIGAFAIERRLIKWYGRIIDSSGILLNKSEGGEGSSGFKQDREVVEARAKKLRGRKNSEELRLRKKLARQQQEPFSKEKQDIVNQKISQNKKGKPNGKLGIPMTIEQKEKIRLAQLERWRIRKEREC